MSRGHMDELFLAIVGCDAREMELHCAVALGSDYRRSQIPMPLAVPRSKLRHQEIDST